MSELIFYVDPVTNNILGMIERDPLFEAFNSPPAIDEFKRAHDEAFDRIMMDSLKGLIDE